MSASVSESEEQATGKLGAPPVVEVSRAVSAPLTHVWEVLVSPAGAEALLGEGARLGGKGEPYHCSDGVSGVLRSYHPLEQLRVSWHETPDSPPSIVEIDLRTDGDATRLDLRQDHLSAVSDVDALTTRWNAALAALAQAAES
ncbi:MAG: hypothetical protein U0Q19_12200 [Kineosporiaceae bacterium]